MSISIRDIKNTLSEFTFNLGNLCKSSKVNKWSFRKPINSPSLNALTDNDYYNADDGFNLSTFNSAQLMMNELQNPDTDLWEYEDREAPYRLSDFSEYAHYAPVMFELSFVNLNTGTFGETLRISCSSDIQWFVNNFATAKTLSSTGDLILLIFERNKAYDQSGMQTIGIYKVCQFINFDGEDIRFTIPDSTSIQTGEYTLVPCISTATSRFNDGEYYYYNPNTETLVGQWLPFPPHSKLNFSITSVSPTHLDFFSLFDFNDFYAVSFDYTAQNYELRDITFSHYMYYNGSNNRQFTVSVEYYYDNTATPVMIGQCSRTMNRDNIVETANIVYRGPITVISDARLEEDIISIRYVVRISSNGETQTKTFNATLEKS